MPYGCHVCGKRGRCGYMCICGTPEGEKYLKAREKRLEELREHLKKIQKD